MDLQKSCRGQLFLGYQMQIWIELIKAVSTSVIAITAILGAWFTLKQIRKAGEIGQRHHELLMEQIRTSMEHATDGRELLIKQLQIENEKLEMSVQQQKNAIVMQLWQNWDNALDVGNTRDDLRRFVSWLATDSEPSEREIWISLFANGHTYGNLRTHDLIDNASDFVSEKFAPNGKKLSIEDITRIRGSLNRFLNMVEQAAVAYLHEFGNSHVMEMCMVPTLVRYSIDLRPYMDAICEEEPETWRPIYKLLAKHQPATAESLSMTG